MPFCEIKFTVLLMNSLHQIQIALQIASSCKVCASTLRLCGVIQGSVSQTESHNWLLERCPSVFIMIQTPHQTHPARFLVKCGFSSAVHVLVLPTGALGRELGSCGSAPRPGGAARARWGLHSAFAAAGEFPSTCSSLVPSVRKCCQ